MNGRIDSGLGQIVIDTRKVFHTWRNRADHGGIKRCVMV